MGISIVSCIVCLRERVCVRVREGRSRDGGMKVGKRKDEEKRGEGKAFMSSSS